MKRPATGFAVSIGLALGVALGACGAPKAGVIGPSGYRHPVYPYGVVHAAGDKLLPPDWIVDNYFVKGKAITAKKSADFMTTFELDLDNDGVVDDKVKAFRYDLLFIHQRTAATISLRTVPLSYESANLNLEILARRFADALAGGEFELVEFGSAEQARLQVVEKRRYSTTIESVGQATLAGQPAVETTILVKNVDQASSEAKLRVVFSRPGFIFQHRRGVKVAKYPVLLIAAYRALPMVFPQNLGDFQRLMNSIVVGSAQGYVGPAAAPAPQVAPASVPVTPAPPAQPAPPIAPSPAAPVAPPASSGAAPGAVPPAAATSNPATGF